ncbi:MAG: HEPN domain-containing protein [Bacteroidota bacterium]
MKDVTRSWLAYAERDILAAQELLDNEELTNIVTFHCQQAIEKSLKALLEEQSADVPKIHSLVRLFSFLPDVLKQRLPIPLDDLRLLDQVYSDSRYPPDLGLLPTGFPTRQEAKQLFEKAQLI